MKLLVPHLHVFLMSPLFPPLAETHFANLLDSEVTNRIIEMKVDAALKRPEGMNTLPVLHYQFCTFCHIMSALIGMCYLVTTYSVPEQ